MLLNEYRSRTVERAGKATTPRQKGMAEVWSGAPKKNWSSCRRHDRTRNRQLYAPARTEATWPAQAVPGTSEGGDEGKHERRNRQGSRPGSDTRPPGRKRPGISRASGPPTGATVRRGSTVRGWWRGIGCRSRDPDRSTTGGRWARVPRTRCAMNASRSRHGGRAERRSARTIASRTSPASPVRARADAASVKWMRDWRG